VRSEFYVLKRWAAGLLLAQLALSLAAWADCQADYNAAFSVLDATQKQAEASQHPSADGFSNAFQVAVDKLKDERCTPEMVKLIEHIQSEQLKYPSAIPIED
jgi:hypothetical protein